MRRAFTKPKVSIVKTKVQNIALSGTELLLTIGIDNPNSYGLNVKKFRYHLSLDGQELMQGAKDESVDIRAEKITLFTVPLTLRYSGLMHGVSSLLYKNKIRYTFTGDVTIDTPVGDITFDLGRKGEIPIPNKPDVSVEKVRLAEMGLSKAVLIFTVRIDNNEDVSLDLKRFKFHLKIQNQEVFSIRKKLDLFLTKRRAVKFDVPVLLSLRNLSSSIIKTITSGKIKYEIDFDLNLDSRYGPFSLPWKMKSQTTMY